MSMQGCWRTLVVIVCAGFVSAPVSARPKVPDVQEPLPDIEQMLTRAGWTMTPEMSAKFSQPGDILDADHTTLMAGPTCFSAEVQEGAYAAMEVTRSMSAGVRMRAVVVGAKANMVLEKKIIFDRPIYRQIPRLQLQASNTCLQTLRQAELRGEDISGWYVITESLSAVIQQQECGSFDAESGNFVVSGDAAVQAACAQTSLEPVAVAIKTMPVAMLLGRAGSPVMGPVSETGEATDDLGASVDFATLAAQAAQAKAVRERGERALAAEQVRLVAEQARLAEIERRAQAALAAEQRRRIATKKADVLAEAKRDFAAIRPLLDSAPTKETRPVLRAFIRRYAQVTVQVDEIVETVDVPGVAEVRRNLETGARAQPPSREKKRRSSPHRTAFLVGGSLTTAAGLGIVIGTKLAADSARQDGGSEDDWAGLVAFNSVGWVVLAGGAGLTGYGLYLRPTGIGVSARW